MLSLLRIKNMFLIEEAELNLEKGLNILSGETGAGKSILIDSLVFLLGGRADKEMVKTGCTQALVEGILSLDSESVRAQIADLGIAAEEELLISRSIASNGKSTCRLNGHPVTLSMLRELSAVLVDVQGQHEHQSLLNPLRHGDLLDRLCDPELVEVKSKIMDKVKQYREFTRAYNDFVSDEKERNKRLEIYRFQANEIKKANLKPDEEEELLEKSRMLGSLNRISEATQTALTLMRGDEGGDVSAYDKLSRARRLISDAGNLDRRLSNIANLINEGLVQLDEAILQLQYYTDMSLNPGELDEIEHRLDLIQAMKKKYGLPVKEILQYCERISQEINAYENSEEALLQLLKQKKQSEEELLVLCKAASDLRKAGATYVKERIEKTLNDLGMKKVSFEIVIERKTGVSSTGYDRVEFLISPNPGEPLRPLARIASGGEMSRVMLALKSVLAHVDQIGTFIFDEIDAGVSGRTAQHVAEVLRALSKTHQLIVITHLPQIAAVGDCHFQIEKTVDSDKTISKVKRLDDEGCVKELARLIGGSKITEATLMAAAEMRELGRVLEI